MKLLVKKQEKKQERNPKTQPVDQDILATEFQSCGALCRS